MKPSRTRRFFVFCLLCSSFLCAMPAISAPQLASQERIDLDRARQLLQKRRSGGTLTTEEEAYLKKALEARRTQGPAASARIEPKESAGLKPLTEFSPNDRYKGQDGGLYGEGRNSPPDWHRAGAELELAKIEPLDATGKRAQDGKVVFVSISMSNATQEFSVFKKLADADAAKSPSVVIVDCAQGGQAMAEWADPNANAWVEAERRLATANVTSHQVQVAWIKLANKSPRGDLAEHGKKLHADTITVLQNAKARFPNLRVAYLGSRIYGGHGTSALNPEPYAYESAFVCRWLIQAQVTGDSALNYDPKRGPVKTPLLLWGPYLWADGSTPRRQDQLVWTRDDFVRDGTHPSLAGREKVARLLLDFCKNDPLAKSWFVKSGARN